MNETNSSAKHYDMMVIGSGDAGHHGWNGYPKITVIAKARFRDRNHLSEMATIRPSDD